MDARGSQWDDVLDKRAGVVEVGVYRNLLTHGMQVFDTSSVNRVVNAGGSPLWKTGDRVALTYEVVTQFRARLKKAFSV